MNKKTNKTAHVLRLLANSDATIKENPILNEEFKDEMILNRHTHKGEELDQAQENIILPKTVGINIVSDLIEENLLTVLERFRCCTCEKCMKYISIEALNQLQPKYVSAEDVSEQEISSLKEKYKTSVVTVLLKIALQIKSNPIHK